MTTASDIIQAKGGPAAFATSIDKPPLVVRMWKHRNRLPRNAWPEIIAAHPDLTLEVLLETEHPRAA